MLKYLGGKKKSKSKSSQKAKEGHDGDDSSSFGGSSPRARSVNLETDSPLSLGTPSPVAQSEVNVGLGNLEQVPKTANPSAQGQYGKSGTRPFIPLIALSGRERKSSLSNEGRKSAEQGAAAPKASIQAPEEAGSSINVSYNIEVGSHYATFSCWHR